MSHITTQILHITLNVSSDECSYVYQLEILKNDLDIHSMFLCMVPKDRVLYPLDRSNYNYPKCHKSLI